MTLHRVSLVRTLAHAVLQLISENEVGGLARDLSPIA